VASRPADGTHPAALASLTVPAKKDIYAEAVHQYFPALSQTPVRGPGLSRLYARPHECLLDPLASGGCRIVRRLQIYFIYAPLLASSDGTLRAAGQAISCHSILTPRLAQRSAAQSIRAVSHRDGLVSTVQWFGPGAEAVFREALMSEFPGAKAFAAILSP
jgi:hypothetical protein